MSFSRFRFVSVFAPVVALVFLPAAACLSRAQLPPELAAPARPGPQNAPAASARPRERPLADTAGADRELRDIVARQNEIFASAEAAGDRFDRDNFRSQMQQLTQRYDRLLRAHGNYVAGYVAYGLLLGKIGMSKDGAALMHRANQLDGSLAVVKNQLGNFCAEEGRPLEAFVFYNAAISLEPGEPLYHHQLGALLLEARDSFLKDTPGMWTRAKIDGAMQAALLRATELAPGDWRYAYAYGMSFYELQTGEWEAALQFWKAFEPKLKPGVEQQVCRLHQAKALLELRRIREAEALLGTVTASQLAAQRAAVAVTLGALRGKGVVDQGEDARPGDAEPAPDAAGNRDVAK